MKGVEKDHNSHFLKASFTLAGYLLESESAGAAILAGMRVSAEVLGAAASIFVPFNEWEQSMPVLKFGDAEFLHDDDWQARVSEASTRYTCRSCATRQSDLICPLLHDVSDQKNVYCIGLMREGREIGVISLFFSSPPKFSNEQKLFLNELVRLTDLTLSGLHMHELKSETTLRAFQPDAIKDKLTSLDEKNEEMLELLEYKAIVDERARLARELHDGLAQTLAFLKIEAGRLQNYNLKGDVDTVAHTLDACYRTLADAYLDTRQAIDNLNRSPNISLGDWLSETADDFKEVTGQEVNVVMRGLAQTHSPALKVQLTRIVQEALNNVRKHAEACTVTISAVQTEKNLTLEVRDTGRGFCPVDIPQTSHYGLRTMRERAELIGADFQITSQEGKGTIVTLSIPIGEKQLQ